jgi:two-component system, NarL family, sensor histidine kinase UhpB
MWRGLLYGAAVGVVAGHPLFTAAHHLHECFGRQTPLALTQTILQSFSYQAWPLILFFAVAGGALGMLWGRLHHRVEANRLEYQARLRALAAEISLAEERERHRLATELHEHVGQILSVAQIKMGTLAAEVKTPVYLAALREARGHVDASIRYIRSLTGELSPPVLYDLGFAPAVVWLARQIHDQQGIEVELRQHPIAWPPCDDSQILLFIILRDLLTYVSRETRPRVIKILMQTEGNNLNLEVEHDGAGSADTASDPPGFALFSIRERLDRIGGTVTVEAPSGRGTVITLIVPLRR